ncbi:MAG: peptide/nickel transport system substrate-binding protein [Thermoleophilaceae bacterium]|jgi:peptide/nickel transport system substrate-binding protein|nr:peptide/nickel transport system substrate-binding protein [Thermoleophilaceae bacterium]
MILALAVAALLGAGCGSSSAPQADKSFTYAAGSQIMIGWDPSTSYSNEILAMQNMYETLTRYNAETAKAEPLLATKWTSSDDAKTWTFDIRKGVTFHTGRPVTPAAVKASIDRTIKLNEGAAGIWSSVDSITTRGDNQVVFKLKFPAAIDLVASASYASYIYDPEVAPAKDLKKWFTDGNEAGTGPYQLASWKKGQDVEVRLKQYPKYWGGWKGRHYDRLVFRVVPAATTAAQLLRSGEVDFVQRLGPQLASSFKNDENVVVTAQPSWQNLIAMYNTQRPPLDDKRVRQAISYAIPYKGIIDSLKGGVAPSSGIIPEGLWGYTEDLPNFTYDPAKAKQLLADAGYGPGGKAMKLSLTYVQGDTDEQQVTTLMKSELAQLNIDVDVQPLQWQTQWSKAQSEKESERQDMLLWYWWPDYPNPYSWFKSLFRTESPPYANLAYYSNESVDKQIDEVDAIAATDRDAAIAVYKDLQEQLIEDAPGVSVYTQVYQRAMLTGIGGFKENPAYPNVVFGYDLTPPE